MSDIDPVRGYGPLEAFFGAPEGVSLRAENGNFLSVVERDNVYNIEAAKQTKDQWCKFFVEKLDNGKVRLKDRRGAFLSRVERHGRNNIESGTLVPHLCGEFLVYTRNGRVIFQADNGLFLSRIYWESSNTNSLEAVKKDVDVFCEFGPDTGAFSMPAFQIVNIEIFKPMCNLTKKRVTLKEKEYVNMSKLEQKHTFSMTWDENVTDVTKWNRAWGLNTTTSARTHSFGPLHAITVSYDDEQGMNCSQERVISEVENVEVTIPPNRKISAKLMVTIDDAPDIPFTATIRKVNDNGKIEMLTEAGTWKGVAYNNVGVEIEEQPL